MRDRRGWIVPVVVGMFAMAIGLVLGSGPLRTALIGSLGAQVSSLEDQVADAELAADQANVSNDYGDDWVDAISPQLLGDTLAGHAVALVSVDAPDVDDVDAVGGHIEDSGGAVASAVVIEPLWTDPNQSAFRAALAPQLAPSVVGLDGTESVDEVFAQALAQALIPDYLPAATDGAEAGSGDDEESSSAAPIGPAEEDRGAVLWNLLSDAGLVSGSRDAAADSVVIVAGEAPKQEDDSTLASQANATLVEVFAQYDAPVVAANGPDSDGDLVSVVMADKDGMATRVSTVTWIQTPYSQVTVSLALREQFDGWVGHYGPGDATEPAPPPLGQ